MRWDTLFTPVHLVSCFQWFIEHPGDWGKGADLTDAQKNRLLCNILGEHGEQWLDLCMDGVHSPLDTTPHAMFLQTVRQCLQDPIICCNATKPLSTLALQWQRAPLAFWNSWLRFTLPLIQCCYKLSMQCLYMGCQCLHSTLAPSRYSLLVTFHAVLVFHQVLPPKLWIYAWGDELAIRTSLRQNYGTVSMWTCRAGTSREQMS